MFKKIYAPLSVQWEVIPECNHNCIHCYNYWRRSDVNEPNEKDCSYVSRDKVVDELIRSKVYDVTITGGEPLLIFDQIKPCIEKLLANKLRVCINTNAALLNDEIAEYLAQNSVSILVSLPCCNPEINDQITGCSGSFIDIIKGIETAKKYGVKVGVNMVVSKINQQYVIQTAQFLKEKFGFKSFNATKVGKPINATEEFDKYALDLNDLRKLFDDLLYINHELGINVDSLHPYPTCSYVTQESFELLGTKRKCCAGRTTAGIGFDGNVRACIRDQHSYGNLKIDTLIECWDRMSDWRDDTYLPENCKECNNKEICLGSCRVEAFSNSGYLKADDPCVDLSNLPIKLSYPKSKEIEFNDDELFLLNEELVITNEEFGFRVTINAKSVFITDELCKFIQAYKGKVFTKVDLKTYFKIDEELTNKLLTFLNKNNLSVVV